MISIDEVVGLVLRLVEDRKTVQAELEKALKEIELLKGQIEALKAANGRS